METIYELRCGGADALRLFRSDAVPRTQALRIHYHTSVELSLILSGTGTYQACSRTFSISPGDMFFFRPNEAHCITDIAEGGMSLLNLHIAPYYIYANLPGATHSHYVTMLSTNYSLPSPRLSDLVGEENINVLQTLFYKIRDEFQNRSEDFVLLANNTISELFILIFRHLPKTDAASVALPYEKAAEAIAYIDRRFREEITLEEIATAAGYSRAYLSTVFRRCMGMSVWDYVSIRRMEAAIEEIRKTTDSLLTVALRCGFNNAVQFGKVFRKYTGQTPGAFRRGGAPKIN